MAKVSFFTAVSFQDQPKSLSQSLLEKVDGYFHLGGQKAQVISGHVQQGSIGTVLKKDSPGYFITALKIISYLSVIIPVILLSAKAILRSIYSFHIIEAKKWLEEGIDISQETIEKIQALMPKILRRQKDAEIVWHAKNNNLVFRLATLPNLTFKMAYPDVIVGRGSRALSAEQISEERYANMIKAKEICLANQLGLIVIPHAKKFNVAGMTLIAEERLNINPNESAQEHFYQFSGLNETTRQLATFVVNTGFSDVTWRNMPLLDTAPEFKGNRRVALIDFEEMDGANTGIFGSGGRRGLIGCLHSEAQIDTALAIAQRHGIRSKYGSSEEVKAERMKEIQSDQQLQQHYQRNGILENARKPIQVDDLTTLGLNLDEPGELRVREVFMNGSDGEQMTRSRKQPITLKDAVVDVIDQINVALRKTPDNASIKGKRYILLNTNKSDRLADYHCLGLPKNQHFVTEEEKNQLWLRRIINALIAKGHLFKLVKVNGNGYFIQA